MRRGAWFGLLSLVVASTAPAQRPAASDAELREATEALEARLVEIEEDWRERRRSSAEVDVGQRNLFGYNPPLSAVQAAAFRATLWERQGREEDARIAAELLLRVARYRDEIPEDLRAARPEYRHGLPAVPSFFQLGDYADSWRRIRGAPSLPPDSAARMSEAIATSARYLLVFPEWGAHNRALLRAVCLAQCARALPEHPEASRWSQMASILAEDSFGQWEVEDANGYHCFWLFAAMEYADATGERRWFEAPQMRFYLRYFLELLTPAGNLPAFGDGRWGHGQSTLCCCFARGALEYGDPELQWAARRVFDQDVDSVARRAAIERRLGGRWDLDAPAREPRSSLGVGRDAVIGKKIVFRDGWGPEASYLLLNYRDEGDWGRLDRDYLRQTLAVEEEKMHHGHEDENSLALWMHGGSVLLQDAGYRELLPSGPYGAYRSDLHHNRLVVRRGKRDRRQSLPEFLRDAGAYEAVRTQEIDTVDFARAHSSRTRVIDPHRGVTTDRILVWIPEEPVLLVVDCLRADEEGYVSAAPLWATQSELARGPDWVLGRTRHTGTAEVPGPYDLLVVMPEGDSAVPWELESFELRRNRQAERVHTRMSSRWMDRGAIATQVSVLVPLREGADPAAAAARVRLGDVSHPEAAVHVIYEGRSRWSVGIKTDRQLDLVPDELRPRYDPARGTVRYGRRTTDGDLLVVASDDDSDWWAATNMTHVHEGETRWMQADESAFFQPSGRADHVGRAKWRRWEETRER